jgi:hypothetical protein
MIFFHMMLKNNQNIRLNTVILHMFIHMTMGKTIILMMQSYTATIVPITNLSKCILGTRNDMQLTGILDHLVI